MRLRYLFLALVLAGIAYLALWPVPIDPVAWEPLDPPSTESGAHAYNEHLRGVERLAEGVGHGPEAIDIDDRGRLYTAFEDGRVMRFDADGTDGKLLATTRGRPLGLDVMADGSLIVADAIEGLLRVSDGYAYTLSVTADGTPYRFVDDVVVNADETVAYFTDASSKFGIHETMANAFEHTPHGRVLAYDLETDRVRVLAEDLYFPNGITLGPDEQYLLFNETTRYQIKRHWLKGERAGETEVLVENLPGFPDNITFNGEDRFWVALYAPRNPTLDALMPYPFLRKVAYRLPEAVQPLPELHGYVLAISPEGELLADLQYAGEGAYGPITSAIEHDGALYLGSLSAPAIGRIALDALPALTPETPPDDASAAPSGAEADADSGPGGAAEPEAGAPESSGSAPDEGRSAETTDADAEADATADDASTADETELMKELQRERAAQREADNADAGDDAADEGEGEAADTDAGAD